MPRVPPNLSGVAQIGVNGSLLSCLMSMTAGYSNDKLSKRHLAAEIRAIEGFLVVNPPILLTSHEGQTKGRKV
jgi:hypothetical protein